MMHEVYGETLFNFLYGNVKGYDICNAAKLQHGDKETVKELLYGEVPFFVWKDIVRRANPKKNGVFIDVGSGTGRVVMASYLLCDFRKSIGVELLKGLYDKSCEVMHKFDNYVRPRIAADIQGREMEMVHANIFAIDVSDADLIFMNHPFKDRALLTQLEEKLLRELKPQTKIVTTIKSLDHPRFKYKGSENYTFSWGESTAYFYEK